MSRTLRLKTVDGFVAFDLDDCPVSAGGTRLAPDVSEREVQLLARAMTYKYACFGIRMGGAKGGIRGSAADRTDLLRRYCEEIRPLCESKRFLTGPDLGTFESDFTPLRRADDPIPAAIATPLDGVPFEDVLTGFGVVASAEAALGPLGGRSFAIEGFGKVGGGVAREAARRGGRVVALSTVAGSVHDPRGLDVDALWRLRAAHGDDLVRHLGLEIRPPSALFEVEADVIVPGARPGAIDLSRAGSVRALVIAPAANVPYVAGAPEVLRPRGIVALADFVCNAGAVLGYLAPPTSATHREVLDLVEEKIADVTRRACAHPEGAFPGACSIAREFLRTWRREEPPPPLA